MSVIKIIGGIKMPRGDGTGPMGIGPRSGRGAGYCTGYNAPRHSFWGSGRGMRRIYNVSCGDVDKKEFLSMKVKTLENKLERIKKRLESMQDVK